MTLPLPLCRSWLFVGGAEERALAAVPGSGADVAILELEDFTPPAARPAARAAAPGLFESWRSAGLVPAVRVNPFWDGGREDLAAVMAGRPAVVMLPKVRGPDDVIVLEQAVAAEERRLGLPEGSTRLVPNCESAKALFAVQEIARASARVVACLLASEDLATDLAAPRTQEGGELAFARAFFHAACVAAGVRSIDCPYTFADVDGAARHARSARALGYTAKSLVDPMHTQAINAAFTPSAEEIGHARRVVAAFTAARAKGEGRVLLDGHALEVPTLRNAQSLIERAAALAQEECHG
ncbi:MAG TPA: aldolase/citrate lyase family protein [Kiloniellales bacterium]|nr:aldolase/citrate lyase family protein [Kiloniellales bacterium]